MNNLHVRFWLGINEGFDICCKKCSISLSTRTIYIYTDYDENIVSLYSLHFDYLINPAPPRVEFISADEAGKKFTCYNNIVTAFEKYDLQYYKEF